MKNRKFLKYFLFVLVFASFILGSANQAQNVVAMPMSPVDESKVPHYFGPYPNWANSPFTLPDATVVITGDGFGRGAAATVGANGAITDITITNPGRLFKCEGRYHRILVQGRQLRPLSRRPVRHAVNMTAGTGYTAPNVVISGGGPVGVPATVVAVASNMYSVSVGSATGGSFTLLVDAALTAPIAWNAAAVDVVPSQCWCCSATLAYGGVDPLITLTVTPASVVLDPTGLTQGVADASASVGGTADVWNVTAGSATGGSFTLNVDGLVSGPILWNAAALNVESALSLAGVTATVTGTGSIADPWVITFAVTPVSVTIDSALLTQGVADTSTLHFAADTYVVDLGTAYGGSFTLSVDGVTTASIAWNASAADIQTALGLISVTASVGGASPTWSVVFAVAPTTVSIDGSGLAQPPSLGATATAYGSVEGVVLDNPGLGYAIPTVDFDMPNDPDGIQATGHAVCVEALCRPSPRRLR